MLHKSGCRSVQNKSLSLPCDRLLFLLGTGLPIYFCFGLGKRHPPPAYIIREFGIRKGLKKLVISSKIRIFIGENQ